MSPDNKVRLPAPCMAALENLAFRLEALEFARVRRRSRITATAVLALLTPMLGKEWGEPSTTPRDVARAEDLLRLLAATDADLAAFLRERHAQRAPPAPRQEAAHG